MSLAGRLLMFSLLASFWAPADRPGSRGRTLAAEPLEPRQMLAAAGLVAVGSQPDGALDGKVVYVHGGHGLTANSSGNWGYQRPLLLDMVEDLGNQDQMSLLADELWRAGATVVPLRPVGKQAVERVLDNDDAGVTFTGSWSDGTSSIYYTGDSDADAVRFRFANTSTTETAVATYRPDLPTAGFYPVYTWASAGTNRATDQLYRVIHSGGATEVTVDHSRVGNGLVYLGTYHFEAGTAGAVEISNRSNDAGRVVVADMIRFGNGMGDINRGAGVSGQPRENEAGLYWVEWHVDRAQGIAETEYRTSSDDSTATVSLSPRYAEFMNQQAVGVLSDRVFLSYHSNASTGNPATATARGVVGLHNTSSGGATPNQLTLANLVARQINDDLVAQNGQFEHNWSNRTTVTFETTFNYGEINNSVIAGEFDATILETGFHDNTQDAQLLRDRRVREAIAKATVQGTIDYFDQLDTTTVNTDPPPRLASLSGESAAPGEVTLRWTAGTTGGVGGAAPTGYMVYASTNGLGFDGGRLVSGAATTSTTITGLTPGETYYFRVHPVNGGGEAPPSEVVAVKPSASGDRVLIVNGFDRQDRSLSEREPFLGGSSRAERVRLYGSNTRDYVTEVAGALDAAGATAAIATASNEAVASGLVSLAGYDAVVWISGSESSGTSSFNASEQNRVSAYLAAGGKLFASGAEIGWDLDNLNNGRAFYNNTLRADFVADDAGVYNAAGVVGSIFAGLNLTFDNGAVAYDVALPDTLAASAGSTVALTYAGGAGAGVVFSNLLSGERLVNLGFPFESITSAASRAAMMDRVLEFFGLAQRDPAAPLTGDFSGDGLVDAADYTVWRDTQGQFVTPFSGADADGSGLVDAADEAIWRATYGQTVPAPAATPAAVTAPAEPTPEPPAAPTPTPATNPTTPTAPAARPGAAGFRAPLRAADYDAALLLVVEEEGRTRLHGRDPVRPKLAPAPQGPSEAGGVSAALRFDGGIAGRYYAIRPA